MDKRETTIQNRKVFIEIVSREFANKIAANMSMSGKTRSALRKACVDAGIIKESKNDSAFKNLLDFYEDIQKGNDMRLYRCSTNESSVHKTSTKNKRTYRHASKKIGEFTPKDIASLFLDIISGDKKRCEILEDHDIIWSQYNVFLRELYNDGTICGVRVLNYNNIGKPNSKTDLFRFSKGFKLTFDRPEEDICYRKKLAVLLLRLKRSLNTIVNN